jgi:hypothetical protein
MFAPRGGTPMLENRRQLAIQIGDIQIGDIQIGGYCVSEGGEKGRAGSPPCAPAPWRRRMPAGARTECAPRR